MPAELVSAAVAVLPDPGAEPLRLGNQLLARHRLEILVRSSRLNPWPAPARSRPGELAAMLRAQQLDRAASGCILGEQFVRQRRDRLVDCARGLDATLCGFV
jgi:hypothetical protein